MLRRVCFDVEQAATRAINRTTVDARFHVPAIALVNQTWARVSPKAVPRNRPKAQKMAENGTENGPGIHRCHKNA